MKDKAFFPLVEAHGGIPNREPIRPHQNIMCNNLVIHLNFRTENDDLYIETTQLPLNYTEEGKSLVLAGIIEVEQNPTNVK